MQGVFDQDCEFILDRTEFGKNEVQSAGTPALIQNAFYVVIDGFTAPQLNITSIDPTQPPVVSPTFSSSLVGIGVVATSLQAEDVSLPPNTPQRFTWICAASFPDLTAFNTVPTTATLGASMTATTKQTVSATATVELVQEADPYELDGPVSWLSNDLRVFQIAGTNATLSGLPNVALGNTGDPTADAANFIQGVIAGFNANTAPPPNHPFDAISTDEQVSQVTIAQVNASGQPVPTSPSPACATSPA